MKINISPAEAGAIIYALEKTYPDESPEIQYIAQHLYDCVFNELSDYGFYKVWCEEFKLKDQL